MQTIADDWHTETSSFPMLNHDQNELNAYNMKNSIDHTCRILTVTDVYLALKTLQVEQNRLRKRTNSCDSDPSTMLIKRKSPCIDERHCCRLVRSDKSFRLSLPLARRGRPHLLSRSSSVLCQNCLAIKQQQEIDILQNSQHVKNEVEVKTMNIFDTVIDRTRKSAQETTDEMMIQDIPQAIEYSLISNRDKTHWDNAKYESAEVLVWKMNTSDNHNQTNTVTCSYDSGSLEHAEKRRLIQEAIQKLQIGLSVRSSSSTNTVADSDLDEIEFTYRALQATVCILSSSLD